MAIKKSLLLLLLIVMPIFSLKPLFVKADPAGTQSGSAYSLSGSFKYSKDGFAEVVGVVNGTDGEPYVFKKQTWTTDAKIWYATKERGGSNYYYISVSPDSPYSGSLSYVSVDASGKASYLNGPSKITINKFETPINTTDNSNNGSSNSTSSSSASGNTSASSTPKAPLGISLGNAKETNAPAITATKGCNKDTNKYERGLLKDLPCQGALKSLNGILIFIKNILFVILLPTAGVLFLIMFIVGGIVYITAAGNQQRAERAKKILTSAVFGLLIVILSYTIIRIFISILGGGIKTT